MVWKQLQRQLTRSRCSNCTDNNICLWKLDYILCQQKCLLIPQTAFRKEISRQAATLTSSKVTEWASNTWNLLNTVGYPLMVRLFYIIAFVIRNGIGPCIIKKVCRHTAWNWMKLKFLLITGLAVMGGCQFSGYYFWHLSSTRELFRLSKRRSCNWL